MPYEILLKELLTLSKSASKKLISISEEEKNKALLTIADDLEIKTSEILEANKKDLENATANGVKKVMIDRLALNEKRIKDMANGIRQVVDLDDPTGISLDKIVREDGLTIEKVSVPLGVILMIYEARPNVTVDAAVLALKSGNAAVLRGGKEAFETNKILVEIIQKSISMQGIVEEAVQLIPITDRAAVGTLLSLKEYIDVVIPRGSAGLINYVVNESKIPVLETGAGICHVYIHENADQEIARNVLMNAKVQRPSVCNAAETALIDKKIAKETLENVLPDLWNNKVEVRISLEYYDLAKTILEKYISNSEKSDEKLMLKVATAEDWATEYNDLTLAIRVVENIDEAIKHIDKYSTKHSEAIITANDDAARRFMKNIDASTVYHNASTRFTDGFEFGFGAEIGISTQKLHARGPMGLKALTTYKYCVYGKGHTRK